MAGQELRASLTPVIESSLPPFSSLPVASQEQFTFQLLDNVPLFQFSKDVPLLDHKPPSISPARPGTPEIACTSDRYATTAVFVPAQDEFSHPPPWPMPFDAQPETAWPNYHHQSPITSPVFQSQHIAQPFLGLRIAGTFTFDVSPMIPYFDFSHHLPPAPPNGIEFDVIPQATTAIQSNSQEMNDAWPPISASREYIPQHLSFDRGVRIQQVPRNVAPHPQGAMSNPLAQPFALAEHSGSGDM
ncbi:hypothetical protein H4582DRAFT_1303489 [Lactarius indigo]|nr:hypothetical protein H4582DRAFT_1303489 [Lactarius indigo]